VAHKENIFQLASTQKNVALKRKFQHLCMLSPARIPLIRIFNLPQKERCRCPI